MDKYLLSDEEQYNIMLNCGKSYDDCHFPKVTCTPCKQVLTAQHLKTVKAVFEEVVELKLWYYERDEIIAKLNTLKKQFMEDK